MRAALLVLLLACCVPAHSQAAEETAPRFETMSVGAAKFELQFAPGLDTTRRGEVRDWIDRSARAVAGYFGKFPVATATILVIPVDGNSVNSGTAFNDSELRIRVRIGRDITHGKLLSDWILVHEMVHLAIPEVPRNQNWFHEGAATYVEIISRAKAGLSGSAGGWAELFRNVGQGMPQSGDRGLDHTPTWGRIYWGGAMFCMLADIELRKRSHNKVGLQHALRGIVAGGGNYAVEWPLEKTLKVADEATGFTVLSDLHARMQDSAGVSASLLAEIWRDLGISEVDGVIVFRDDAPLADIRRKIIAAG
ncbi:MAG: hypothetical protein ABI905_00570 [Betaproteobacteria bacterium]